MVFHVCFIFPCCFLHSGPPNQAPTWTPWRLRHPGHPRHQISFRVRHVPEVEGRGRDPQRPQLPSFLLLFFRGLSLWCVGQVNIHNAEWTNWCCTRGRKKPQKHLATSMDHWCSVVQDALIFYFKSRDSKQISTCSHKLLQFLPASKNM